MRTAFIQTLCDLAAVDETVWLVTADLGYSVLEIYRDRFPKRFINVGVAEQNMAGVAAGLALSGKNVFTYSIANFPTMRCLEQIRNDICYHDGNVKIVAVGAGFTYGSQGYTHHGIEDIAVMGALANMTVVSPADAVETRQLVRQIHQRRGPCYLRLGRAGEPVLHQGAPQLTLGKALWVRPGEHLTFIATGSILKLALDAAETLAREGVRAGVMSVHTIRPFDSEAVVQAARTTGAIVTVEEHNVVGGLGTTVGDTLAEAGLGVTFRKVGVTREMRGVVGSQRYLRTLMGDVAAIGRDAAKQRRPNRR